ncbi:hypothetical protein ACHQM5_005855 [Ranunculus cassubicifolius]
MAIKNATHIRLLGGFSLILLVFISPPSVDAKPFEFLQQLEGSCKGNTVKGVQQLKQYLKRFGYLDASHANNDDEYDELVESAIKTYQLNYHLNVTGSLDSETLREMMKPRCGVPDIVDGMNTMSSGKKKKQHERRLSLRTTTHFAFFPGSPKWGADQTHLTYRFESQIEAVDIGTFRSVAAQAFKRWAQVSQFTFAEAEDGSNSDIVVGFFRSTFDGPGGVLGRSYAPPRGVCTLDADENWSTNPTNDMQTDLESVTVHELGHILGLGHSQVSEAIMFPTYKEGEIKRDLQDDDKQGIHELYGLSR